MYTNNEVIVMSKEYLEEIKSVYKKIKPDIESRIDSYKSIWFNGKNEDVHIELAFCILTPQSKARGAEKAINAMLKANIFWTGLEEELVEYLNTVRFKNTKAKNLVLLREFMKDEEGKIITKTLVDKIGDVFDKRLWLVKNIKGIGYKEASHFLRNIGFCDEVAILDRHILKNIKRLGVINEIPKTITPKKYIEIEKKIDKYCKKIEIPMDHFDLLLWYLEAGEVFK